jgi:DNA repair protein RadC
VPQVVRETTAPVSLRTPEEVAHQLGELSTWAQEAFIVFTLNTKNHIIDRHLVTLGTLNASLVHAREVYRRAVMDSAAAIIIAHNHPSGDPTPSGEDISLTRQLVAAGKALGISVLDHVIVGRPNAARTTAHTSLREAGLVAFE